MRLAPHPHDVLGGTVADRVATLLDKGTGHLDPALIPLATALTTGPTPTPAGRLTWLSKPHNRDLLRALATGRLPLTHDGLTAYPEQAGIPYLRALLVHCGALPQVDQQLIDFQAWLTRRLGRPDTADDLARVLSHLQARVDALDAWRAHQSDLLDEHLNNDPDPDDLDPADDLDGAEIDDTAIGGADLDGHEVGRRPAIGGYALIEWVHDTVAAITAPAAGRVRLVPLWWEHPEAVFRFEALHGAWTELAPEPGAALSIWIRDHLDPCLQVLFSPNGPFADCAHTERHRSSPHPHRPLPTLPTTSPP